MTTTMTTATTVTFSTLKAAFAAGFRRRRDWDYGGQEVTVKDSRLVRNPRKADSYFLYSR